MRSKLELTIEILTAALKEISLAEIVRDVNISYEFAMRYIDFLVKNSYMDKKAEKYLTTAKGRELIEILKKIEIK
jgi:predicted transcriptional regulator